jgi:D-alanine transfer protein
MFRTLREIRARPLVLSMPLNGSYYDAQGISRSARQVYYDKLRDLATRYGIDLIEFEDHDTDPNFQMTRREHPTPYGWKFYDQALDEFFHDRVACREGGS